MRPIFALVVLIYGHPAFAGRAACGINLIPRLAAQDTLTDYADTGKFTFALVERLRAIERAGPSASTHRQAELDRARADLNAVDAALNEIEGGDDAPYQSLGGGLADYAIYRGFEGVTEIITIRRNRRRDDFFWAIEVVHVSNAESRFVTTGLRGDLGDVREAIRMTAHRFPRRIHANAPPTYCRR